MRTAWACIGAAIGGMLLLGGGCPASPELPPGNTGAPSGGQTTGNTGGTGGTGGTPVVVTPCGSSAFACFDSLPTLLTANSDSSNTLAVSSQAIVWNKPEWKPKRSGDPLPPRVLRWRMINPVPQFDAAKQADLVERAFATWANECTLIFVKDDNNPDLTVSFEVMTADQPFECQATPLGRGFFPGSRNPGRIELCRNKNWVLEGNSDATAGQFDMFTAVLHEIGHGLGLDHSRNPDALMFAGYTRRFDALHDLDKAAIRALYGQKSGTAGIARDAVSAPGQNQLTLSDPDLIDTDGDGIPDAYEVLAFGTDPNNPDTDFDSRNDYEEIFIDGTNPNVSDNIDDLTRDTDGDGLFDLNEVYYFGTDPFNADTDFDGLSDGVEIAIGTDPNNADTDYDGLLDGQDPDPRVAQDSDGDGIPDGVELFIFGTDPSRRDTDGDGCDDLTQTIFTLIVGRTPTAADQDGDGLTDAAEVNYFGTDPFNADTDGDGLRDGAEWLIGRDSLAFDFYPDSDFDTLPDAIEELGMGTDPFNADTDGDGLGDAVELFYCTKPLIADTDGDGFSDGLEFRFQFDSVDFVDSDGDDVGDNTEQFYGTDPFNPDTDGDGISDGDELFIYDRDPNDPNR